MKYISVAIDGPAGAGKSTIAKKLAKKLNYVYVDTGAMYRAITYKALKLNIDLNNETEYTFLDNTKLELTPDDRVYIDGEDITQEIRSREVSNNVSIVSSLKIVRDKLVSMQRKIAQNANVIMDGRDIGTNVLKDATLKFFITASVEERARRRYLEIKDKNQDVSMEEIKAEIMQRDYLDINRTLNPLVKAPDAYEIDTSSLTVDEVVDKLIEIILGKVASMSEKDLYEISNYHEGQVVKGTVVQVTDNEVLVDFNYMTEGKIYLNQLTLNPDVQSCKELYKVGDKIKAVIKKIDDEVALLSRLDLEKEEALRKLERNFYHKHIITGKVTEIKDTVLIVNIYGIDCLMPKNEVDVDAKFDVQSLLNQQVKVRVIKFENKKVVVSRRAVIAAELFKEKLHNYKQIKLDAVYEGKVVRVEHYGLLVVANNYQGLVPLKEISHLPFNDISEVAKIGDKVNVKVIEKDDDKLQVLYSIKALLPKPWEVVAQNVKEGDVIEGTIVRITDFGAFVNIYPFVDGLLHKNEFSYNPNVNMFDHIEVGQKIKVKVVKIDANKEKLSLSVKALKTNPWTTCGLKQGKVVEVTVKGFDNGDAIVEFVEDVEGILPKNQVSSEKRITKADDVLAVGQVVTVKVTEFDPEERKLVVSIRRVAEDAEREEFLKYMREQEKVKNDTLGDLFGDKLKELLGNKQE